jgi:hypothetical protein
MWTVGSSAYDNIASYVKGSAKTTGNKVAHFEPKVNAPICLS